MAQTYGTALIPWSPMAGGFLTGKYRRGEARPTDARYQDENEDTDLFSDAAFNVLDVVLAIAAEKGAHQASLRWRGAPSSRGLPAQLSAFARWSSWRTIWGQSTCR